MKVMLIDDDRESLECLGNALRLNDFEVHTYESPEQAVQDYTPSTIDAVITDYNLPGTTGIDVLKSIRKKNKDAPVIIISGAPREKVEALSVEAGANAFFSKPLNIARMISSLKTLAGN
jgi:DNA-binding response OmpR family regulator